VAGATRSACSTALRLRTGCSSLEPQQMRVLPKPPSPRKGHVRLRNEAALSQAPGGAGSRWAPLRELSGLSGSSPA